MAKENPELHFRDELFEELLNGKAIDAPVVKPEPKTEQEEQTTDEKPKKTATVPRVMLNRMENIGRAMFQAKKAQEWLKVSFGGIIEKQKKSFQFYFEEYEKAKEKFREWDEKREQFSNRSLMGFISFLLRFRSLINIFHQIQEIYGKVKDTFQKQKPIGMSNVTFISAIVHDKDTRDIFFGTVFEKIESNITKIAREIVAFLVAPIVAKVYELLKEVMLMILYEIVRYILKKIGKFILNKLGLGFLVDLIDKADSFKVRLGLKIAAITGSIASVTSGSLDLLHGISDGVVARETLGVLFEGQTMSKQTRWMFNKSVAKIMIPAGIAIGGKIGVKKAASFMIDAGVAYNKTKEIQDDISQMVGGFLTQFQLAERQKNEIDNTTNEMMEGIVNMSLKDQENLANSFKSPHSQYLPPDIIKEIKYTNVDNTLVVEAPEIASVALWGQQLFDIFKNFRMSFGQFFAIDIFKQIPLFDVQTPSKPSFKEDWEKGKHIYDSKVENITQQERFLHFVSTIKEESNELTKFTMTAKQGEKSQVLTIQEDGTFTTEPELSLSKDESIFKTDTDLLDGKEGVKKGYSLILKNNNIMCNQIIAICELIDENLIKTYGTKTATE